MSSIKIGNYLRSHAFGLVAIFIAVMGSTVAVGAVTDAKFKKLKKRVASLEGKVIPTSLPPSGPASGSLAGTYPNPSLAANSVGTTQIANAAVTAGKLGTIVTATANISDSDGTLNDNLWTRSAEVTATCPAGSVLLGGGVTQVGSPPILKPEVGIARSAPNAAQTGWVGAIISDAQGQADAPNNFVVRALCLQA